jgi:hypothetical protein
MKIVGFSPLTTLTSFTRICFNIDLMAMGSMDALAASF